MTNLREQDNPLPRQAPDEIDLAVIFGFIGSFFSTIGKAVSYVFRAILNKVYAMAFIVLIGMGVGYFYYSTIKTYYTSSMTLVLAEIRNQFVENQLNRLSVMIDEDNYAAIAEDLDISIEAAEQIKKMEFFNLDQAKVSEDSVLTGSPFEIELSLYNSTLFPSMEVALASYLENNRYFSKQKLIKQREVESMINRLKGEIASLDSVKLVSASPRGPVNGFVYGEPIDPASLFRESVTMYKQQVQLEAELEQLDNIQIVNGFAPRLKPTGPNLMKYLAIGGSIAFIIGTVVAVSLERRKRRATV